MASGGTRAFRGLEARPAGRSGSADSNVTALPSWHLACRRRYRPRPASISRRSTSRPPPWSGPARRPPRRPASAGRAAAARTTPWRYGEGWRRRQPGANPSPVQRAAKQRKYREMRRFQGASQGRDASAAGRRCAVFAGAGARHWGDRRGRRDHRRAKWWRSSGRIRNEASARGASRASGMSWPAASASADVMENRPERPPVNQSSHRAALQSGTLVATIG